MATNPKKRTMKMINRSKLALFIGIIAGYIVLLLFFKRVGVDNDTMVMVFFGFLSTSIALVLLLTHKKALK